MVNDTNRVPSFAGANFLRNLFVSGIALVLTLVLAEIGLRFMRPLDLDCVWPPHRQSVFRPAPGLMPGVTGTHRFTTNSMGIRGNEFGAARRNVRLIFMTQPSIWRGDLPKACLDLLWAGAAGDARLQPGLPYYSASALEIGLNRYNAELLQFCRENKIPSLDLAAMLPKGYNRFLR